MWKKEGESVEAGLYTPAPSQSLTRAILPTQIHVVIQYLFNDELHQQ